MGLGGRGSNRKKNGEVEEREQDKGDEYSYGLVHG